MRPMDSSFSYPQKNVEKAPIISLTGGKHLTSVGSDEAILPPLTGLLYLETAEEADSLEALEFDEDEYPCLPENVMELRLHQRKAILRQYMAAARRKHYSIPS
jgi:hypothetical protein